VAGIVDQLRAVGYSASFLSVEESETAARKGPCVSWEAQQPHPKSQPTEEQALAMAAFLAVEQKSKGANEFR
jgi:hypothetical protein